jgi:hypothetical protein
MKTLSSFQELALLLTAATVGTLAESETMLLRAGKVIQKDAKRRIGQYQPETGPFPEWADLASSTEDEKNRLGYPLEAPLLREGTLRDSIEVEAYPHVVVIGTKMDVGAYQEFGTEKIPPRPYLGPAAYSKAPKVASAIGAFVASGLAGGTRIHPLLGYDMQKLESENH